MEQAPINPTTELNCEQRTVPPALRRVLEFDESMTNEVVTFLLSSPAFRSLKNHSKYLEFSCSGVVWLACWLVFVWLADIPNLYQLQVNLFFGLIFDIVLVLVTKAAVRRRCPLGTDKLSFPSGHTSRATLIMCFLIVLHPIHFIFWPALLAWTTSICLVRILTQCHYVLDVFVGIGLGMFEALVMSIVWLDQEKCARLLAWFRR